MLRLCFTDVSQSDADALALLAMLREGYPEIGVIMMSGAVTAEEIRGLYPDDDGRVQFLAKPFNIADLAGLYVVVGFLS